LQQQKINKRGKSGKSSINMTSTNSSSSDYKQRLQAILLTDTYETKFRPVTLDKTTPFALCPLNNSPLIDYSLDVLSTAPDLQDVFIFISSGYVAIRSYIKDVKKNNKYPNLKLICISEPYCVNVGDALRELDRRGVVRSDPFILLQVGIVSNINLSVVIEEHRMRRKKDSSAILTCVFRCVGNSYFVSSSGELIVGLHDKSNRVLLYDNIKDEAYSSIPCCFFRSYSSVTIRKDLLDAGLYICSPDVLARFSDAFDCVDFRNDFIKNSVGEEEEALQNRIYAYLLPNTEYIHYAFDWRTYHQISHDLLFKWCNFVNDESQLYKFSKHFIYKCLNRSIDRAAILSNGCMVGHNTSISKNSNLKNTILGKRCRLETNVIIKHSHIWNDVLIEDNVRIFNSIICSDVVIKSGALIEKGCVIGKGCIIGSNVVVKEFTRITKFQNYKKEEVDDWNQDIDEFDNVTLPSGSSSSDYQSDSLIVGKDGLGHVWTSSSEEEQDYKMHTIKFDLQSDFNQTCGSLMSLTLQEDEYLTEEDCSKDDDDEEEDEDFFKGQVDKDGFLITGRQKGVNVIQELTNICSEHDSENSVVDHLIIELNAFKFSQNATFSDCTTAAIFAIFKRLHHSSSLIETSVQLMTGFKKELIAWSLAVLRKMVISPEEEKSIIYALEKASFETNYLDQKEEINDNTMNIINSNSIPVILQTQPSFRLLLQTLEDEEILSEDAILEWAEERKSQINDDTFEQVTTLFLQKPTQDFLSWLQDDEEEEGDSQDDGEDDEES